MKEISIIINGERYDSQVADLYNECNDCDLIEFCDMHLGELCSHHLDNGYNFKKQKEKEKSEIIRIGNFYIKCNDNDGIKIYSDDYFAIIPNSNNSIDIIKRNNLKK